MSRSSTRAPATHPRPGRLRRLAGGAAAVVVLIVGGAGPAGAVPQRTLSIDPADDVDTSPVVTGSFKGATLVVSVEKISAVDLKVSPTGPTGGSAVTKNGCEVASEGACNSPSVTYSWEIPALAFNGPYVVEATGRYCDPLLCLNPESASAEPVAFRLGVEPKAPTDLKAEPGEGRSVAVSWARNAEPDLLYYALFRKDPGGEFRRLGNDIKPSASGRPTFSDTSVGGTDGGEFVYRVFAVRKGFTGDEKSTKISKASADRSATVSPPPTTTPPGDPNGPPTTISAGQGVDIGSFLSGQAPTLPTPAPIFLDLPDTGFGEILPFGALPGEDDVEPGEEDAVLPTTPRQREIAQFNRNRPLIPVAAGAVLLVLAAHIRLLNVRIKPTVAPKKLPPGAYVARALNEARAAQAPPTVRIVAPPDVATAVANGGHHRAPPTDDVAGLPVWAEFEPASAMGFFDEYDQGDVFADDGRPAEDAHPDDDLRQFELFAPHPAAPDAAPPSEDIVFAALPGVVVAGGPDATPKRNGRKHRAASRSKATPAPPAAPEPEPAPAPAPEPAFDLDDESQWAAEPEIFVSPRS